MAESKQKDVSGLDDIPSAAGDQEPMDLNALAEDAVSYATEDALAAELATALAERDDMRDRFMRALADAENARKRGERDRREAEQYGGSKLVRDMLPVYDSLVRALESAPEADESTKALVEGVRLTLREFVNIFGKHNVTPIVPVIGDRFDPQLHQAMFEAPVPGTRAGDIIQVMTQGFLLHDRLLRPAQVGVSSTPAS